MSDRRQDIRRALDRFHMEEARALAAEELAENPSAEAYYLASLAALNHGQRMDYLRKALELDAEYAPAVEELADMQPPQPGGKTKRDAEAAPAPKLAGISRRFLALIIDAFAIAIVTVAIMAANGAMEPLYAALYETDDAAVAAAFNQFQSDMLGVNLLVSALYNVGLMTWLNGQTLGKLMLRIRVVKKNGRRFSVIDGLLRNVFGYTISQIFLLGYLWALYDDEQQAWHDKMAGTVVVDERQRAAG